ncbi:MAG: DUF2726 domain-containing protein [Desulfococcaceae bacterium]
MAMSWFYVLIILAILVFLIYSSTKFKGKEDITRNYEACPSLVTPAERSFLGILDKVVQEQYRVFAKVRLSDILKVKKGLSNSARQTALNKITSKHIDFLICNASDLRIICAIELDDKSHSRSDRIKRDDFVDRIFSSAGVPLIRYPAKPTYLLGEIDEKLAKVLQITEGSLSPIPSREIAKAETSEDKKVLCPQCGGEMEKRKAKRGKFAGQYFWGCSNYPVCKGVVKIVKN